MPRWNDPGAFSTSLTPLCVPILCSGQRSARPRAHLQRRCSDQIAIAPVAPACPNPATSCLGASPTPPVGVCGSGTGSGVRETLYGAFRVKGLFLALRGRQGSFVCSHRRPSAGLHPYFCSTPPEAYFRPDQGLPPPTRADDVKAGRTAATEGSAFTSASTSACWLRRVDCSFLLFLALDSSAHDSGSM